MAYQDFFSSQPAPFSSSPVASLVDRLSSMPQPDLRDFTFDPLEKPWYQQNPYGTETATAAPGIAPRQMTGVPTPTRSNPYAGFDMPDRDLFTALGLGESTGFASGLGADAIGRPMATGLGLTENGMNLPDISGRNLFGDGGLGRSMSAGREQSAIDAGGRQMQWYQRPEMDLGTGKPAYGTGGGKQAVYKPGFGQFTPDVIPEINAAAAKYGVPANFLYVIIAKESSGNWDRNNFLSNIRPGSGPLMPYIGVFKNAADSWGMGGLWNAAIGNRALQIEILAGVLRGQYEKLKGQNPSYNWLNVANYHFSGRPVPVGWNDELGNNDQVYYNQTRDWWGMLEPGFNPDGGVAGGGLTGGPSGSSIGVSGIFGGKQARHSQEFGRTAFSQGAGASMYGYGAGLGVAGGHPGIDYSMPSGTQVYIPVSGTVIYGGGSGYFRDYRGDGPGRGELRIQTDDGHLIIFGHMSSIPWRPGQRVTAGQLAGLTGSFNGDHFHLEVRVPGNTSTGWQAVDPEAYFSGQSIAYGGGAPGAGSSQPQASGRPWWYAVHGL